MNKFELVKAMNELILATGDEDIYETWFMTVPDVADDTDFKEIAESEELFKETVNSFIRLSKYFKEGLELFGTWYEG